MLETERVKNLVQSARQFSSVELWTAIGQLKAMANDKQSKEYQENLKAWADQLVPGDPVTIRRGYPKISYGSSGVVVSVQKCRAPKIAFVTVDLGPIGTFYFSIRDVVRFGSVSQSEIKTNQGLSRIFGY